MRSTVSLLRDPGNEPWRIVGVVEDITEHLRLEEAERAREAAELSNRGQERVPLAHEPRAAHAAERDARLRPAARDRPAQSADPDPAALGRADPAGRLAPAGDDQRRARSVAHRVRQPAPADRDARARARSSRRRRRSVASDAALRGIRISAELAPGTVGGPRRRDPRQADPHQPAQQRRQVQRRRRPRPHREPARGTGRGRDLGHRHRPGHDARADGRAVPARSTGSAASARRSREPASAWSSAAVSPS